MLVIVLDFKGLGLRKGRAGPALMTTNSSSSSWVGFKFNIIKVGWEDSMAKI